MPVCDVVGIPSLSKISAAGYLRICQSQVTRPRAQAVSQSLHVGILPQGQAFPPVLGPVATYRIPDIVLGLCL